MWKRCEDVEMNLKKVLEHLTILGLYANFETDSREEFSERSHPRSLMVRYLKGIGF
jgi:hypothetical protein